MIIAVLILLFIGWVVYELWLNPMIPYYENQKKYNEEFLKEYPKGTYITLEWKYFCEFRDEAIKEYEEIYNLINTQPISANEICKMTGKKISEIMQILFMLELDGYIKCVAGNKYIKKE